jgi:hypothetical protein
MRVAKSGVLALENLSSRPGDCNRSATLLWNSTMLRMISIFVLATPVLLLSAGCGDSQSSSPPQTVSQSAATDQADVENLARCFHEAVTVLQAEPESPGELAVFMKNAKAAVDRSGSESGDADFNALLWTPDGTSLMTQSGKLIRSRVANQSHENYGSQGSEWLTEYEFYVGDTDCTSRTTIQLAMCQ